MTSITSSTRSTVTQTTTSTTSATASTTSSATSSTATSSTATSSTGTAEWNASLMMLEDFAIFLVFQVQVEESLRNHGVIFSAFLLYVCFVRTKHQRTSSSFSPKKSQHKNYELYWVVSGHSPALDLLLPLRALPQSCDLPIWIASKHGCIPTREWEKLRTTTSTFSSTISSTSSTAIWTGMIWMFSMCKFGSTGFMPCLWLFAHQQRNFCCESGHKHHNDSNLCHHQLHIQHIHHQSLGQRTWGCRPQAKILFKVSEILVKISRWHNSELRHHQYNFEHHNIGGSKCTTLNWWTCFSCMKMCHRNLELQVLLNLLRKNVLNKREKMHVESHQTEKHEALVFLLEDWGPKAR